jgi:DnaJ-class molecular chaperone
MGNCSACLGNGGTIHQDELGHPEIVECHQCDGTGQVSDTN